VLVFIDESGDPGFKVERGSSPVFVLAMVIFESHDVAHATEQTIRAARARLRVAKEFKFNATSDSIRRGFFDAVSGCDFRVRALVVEKAHVRSAHLKAHKERFYAYFLRQMMTWDGGRLRQAHVRIDGSGDRTFKREFVAYLRRHLSDDRLKSCGFSDSQRDPLIQLADMAVGAIARSYRTDRPDKDTWRKLLSAKIDDVWDFR
jgi:hypothetical protein